MFHKYIVIIFLLSASISSKTYASHCAGGELLYEWVSDSTYHVILKLYRDCSGIPVYPQEVLCITNKCGKPTQTQILKLITAPLPDGSPNGSVVSGGCPGYGNACTKPGSIVPGYEEWWYDTTVVLAGACTEWSFSVTVGGARNQSTNISGGALYLQATLNTAAFPHNNSPVFSIKPIPYCLLNLPYSYNNGVVDKDGDSLVFENIIPMSNGLNCNGVPMTFTSMSPPLNLADNPFQTNNTYSLDSFTGSMMFTPALKGAQATTIKVKEYRNGILVGTVIRDIQIQVLTGVNPDSTFYNMDKLSFINCVYRNGVIYACTNKSVKLCYNVLSSNINSQLIISDNHNALFSGGTVSYTNQATGNVQGCYSFTTPSTPQKKNLLVTVKDSTCKPPTGIIFYQVLTIPIIISDTTPQLSVVKNYSYCQYDVAQPLSGTGTGLLWYEPGNVNGVSKAPTPPTDKAGTITYYAEANNGCYSVWDTITVTVLPKAEASIIVSADTVCINEIMTVENKLHKTQGVNYSWNTDNASTTSNNADKILLLKWDTKGLKKVKLYAYNNLCNQSDSVYIYVTDVITGGYFTVKDSACINEMVIVSLKIKNERSYLLETTDTGIYGKTETQHLLSWRNAGIKRIILTTQVEGCINLPYTHSISINPLPGATIIAGEQICAGEQIVLYAEQQQDCNYQWKPEELFIDPVNQRVKFSNGIFNPVNVSLTVINKYNCINTETVALTPGICCKLLLPNAFTPNSDGLNDVFGIIGFVSLSEFNMIITNRWGQVVFKTNNIGIKWDGTYHTKQQDIGTYNYYITYKCLGQTQLNKERGSLQLIR